MAIQPAPGYNIQWRRDGLLIIQEREQYLTDSITCLESNIAVINRLCAFYTNLVGDPAWPQDYVELARRSVREFVAQLGEFVYDLEMQLKRATLALQVAKDRKDIVSFFPRNFILLPFSLPALSFPYCSLRISLPHGITCTH